MITHDMAIYITLFCAFGLVVWMIILTVITITTRQHLESILTIVHQQIKNEKSDLEAFKYVVDLITELQEAITLINNDIDNLSTLNHVSKETTP